MSNARPERSLVRAAAKLAAFGITVPDGLDACCEYAWWRDEKIPRLRENADTDLDLDALERAVTIWWNAYLDAHPRAERALRYERLGEELIRLARATRHPDRDPADETRHLDGITAELTELCATLPR